MRSTGSVLLHLLPACDFRAKPTESKSAVTENMTKDVLIEKLKNCIRQPYPAFRKRFLDFSKEPDGKMNVHDFKKVGEWVSLCFYVSSFPEEVQPFSYTNML